MQENDRKYNAEEVVVEEDLYGLAPSFVRAVAEALENDDEGSAKSLAEPLHYSDAADLLERLGPDLRPKLVNVLRADFDPEILTELDGTVREEVVEALGFTDLATAVAELDSDDAVYLVAQLDEDERNRVLDSLPSDTRDIIAQGLSYPEYSAGRMMQRELVAVPGYWTVGETIDYLRASQTVPDEFYDIFVVDPRHRPIGKVVLSRLVRTRRPVRLRDIMEDETISVPVAADQEEVAFLFRQQDLVSAPVVDKAGRLVGVITIDDVVDVIDEEAADDMLRLAGVAETDLFSAVKDTVRSRIPWLLVNSVTAVLASVIIGFFDATLEAIVALAILMPIVAGLGGNAGTQTLTVAVRGLATKELDANNAWKVIGKEILIGLINGITMGLVIGTVAWAWFGDPMLGVVIAIALVFNLLVAGFFGSVIPLTLERLKIDPAVSSSIFLTLFTDCVGFFVFLGLASVFLL